MIKTTTATVDQIPPYCYRLPGISAEAGALAAAKALRITHPCDALALLWELRHVVTESGAEHPCASYKHAEAYFGEFFELSHPLPPISPQKTITNAASKPQSARFDSRQPRGNQPSSHQKETP